MKLSSILRSVVALAVSLSVSDAFAPSSGKSAFSALSRGLASSTSDATDVNIIITGNNIDLTESLHDYIHKKLERPLGKLQANGAIKDCQVHLSVNKNPRVKNNHNVEIVTSLKGVTFRTAQESPDMYASVDTAVHHLARKLRKYKERRLEGWHGGRNMGEDLADALSAVMDEEDPPLTDLSALGASTPSSDDFVDPYAPKVTKIKSFNLGKPMSLQEAIFALDYMDHDFFVFKDDKSGEINVVYKRNAGGVGLIQPTDDDE